MLLDFMAIRFFMPLMSIALIKLGMVRYSQK